MSIAIDLDVLADDYFIRFIIDFESDAIKQKFCDKIKDSSIHYLEIRDNYELSQKSKVNDVDNCIFTLDNMIHSFFHKTTSEIFEMVNMMDHKFVTVMTIPLH